MTDFSYPLVVIGAGAAGLVVATGAAKAGKKVLLIENGTYGGDCTNFGCIPSKSLLASAHIGHAIRSSHKFGVEISTTQFKADKALDRVRRIVQEVVSHENPEALEKLGVATLTGQASLQSPNLLEVAKKDGTIQLISLKKLVIATGSHPHIPAIQGIESVNYLTNETIFDLKTIPKRLVVLGAGPIGCEMAQAFSRLGSEVSIIGTRQVLLPREGPQAQEVLRDVFEKEGIKLFLGFDTVQASAMNQEIILEVVSQKDGLKQCLSATHLLVATGRRPSIAMLQLEKANIVSKDGAIVVDAYGRTSQKHIWAIGDVCGPPFFTHWAEHQARAVLFNILAPSPLKRKIYKTLHVPHVTFTDPEIASLGTAEHELLQKTASNRICTQHVPFSQNDRALTSDETEGFVTIHCKKWSSRIVGTTIVGSRAGEMLCQIATAVQEKIPLRRLANVIHPYPTYSLAIRKAADQWLLQTFLPNLKKLPKQLLRRFWPLLVLLVIGFFVHASGIVNYATFEALKVHRDSLQDFVSAHSTLAPMSYIGIYILATVLDFPVAIFLSITGGFLFSQPWCTLYAVIGASTGATIFFLVAKTVVGDALRKRAGPFLKKIESGFQKDAVSYMLFLRLVPVFPFWLINTAPAIFGISLRTFFLTTFFGIIPGSFVFTQAGRGIDSIFEQGKSFSAQNILTQDIIIALTGLGVLALIPIIVRLIQGRK